jgi:hypothetical protein
MKTLVLLALLAALAGCGHTSQGRERCGAQIDKAWKDLDLAKAQGFAGTVSYGKALALLTRAKANQAVEDFKDCNEVAERARFYIAESRKGR